jgi:hypothetical protein
MGEMFAKLSVWDDLCMKRDSGPGSSFYNNFTHVITIRQDGNHYGDLARMGHEFAHAHQHKVGGDPDPNESILATWMETPRGRDYLQTAGWVFKGFGGECRRTWQKECWTQEMSFCEDEFCGNDRPQGTGWMNPLEENAEFTCEWYNPGSVPHWGRDNLARRAPRRAAWANRWLP